VTLLVVQVLAAVALHQLVAALLTEALAHAAAAVKLILQVHLEVTGAVPGLASLLLVVLHVIIPGLSPAWGRGGRWSVAGGGQGGRVKPGPLGIRRPLSQLGQILLEPVKVLLLFLLELISVKGPLTGHRPAVLLPDTRRPGISRAKTLFLPDSLIEHSPELGSGVLRLGSQQAERLDELGIELYSRHDERRENGDLDLVSEDRGKG